MVVDSFVVSVNTLLMSRLVKFWYVNSGPVFVGWIVMKVLSARMGHKSVLFPARRINVPCLNGSVFDAFIMMDAILSFRVFTSWNRRVVSRSYLFL